MTTSNDLKIKKIKLLITIIEILFTYDNIVNKSCKNYINRFIMNEVIRVLRDNPRQIQQVLKT